MESFLDQLAQDRVHACRVTVADEQGHKLGRVADCKDQKRLNFTELSKKREAGKLLTYLEKAAEYAARMQ